uniref:Uncharacterized protein n=1 Tax=Trieres chinensis TaxID=1514140 RepID=A0A7S1ZD14_TRICV|mmetsp:Transcript_22961/g.46620  ORF Transcript_22961/g.46620 Transcript_22961/m.46620 type:complete len:205 (+) Transcript_22961:106-720(+)|eukprot:CAMPEP_0183293894 /NCGR_PEP_ID=MMETSP0160_2-20130417/2425_1 /TAXON_ID=2839 ORGANISM="Odontella Sinensis, Strain Grunow 1884" /NCGR_SAMPLE_ID=MMETSP0160_2 /ASSEMBLY_ACC=CAM_ASM_000250 /LENGTH=204 /DNA_ID=CAMNT_0025455101 /DNA_START=54 /DNA_END=668 /DNA_ORIENTATION=-
MALSTLSFPEITVYKVVPYEDGTISTSNQIWQDVHESKQLTDWSAMYFQFQTGHALGTVPYRWERNFPSAALVRATLYNLKVHVLNNHSLHDGGVSGLEKADLIKKALRIEQSQSLMEALGERGEAALIQETEEEWELIISHGLLKNTNIKERPLVLFKRHHRFPITRQWKVAGSASWNDWDDGHEAEKQILELVPDLATDWVS